MICIVSAGFAQMNPDSNLIVNALEAVPLDQISREVSAAIKLGCCKGIK